MVRAPRRVAEVAHELGHEEVLLPLSHPLDEGRVRVVVADGNRADEVVVRADAGEAVRPAELGVLRVLEQRRELLLLNVPHVPQGAIPRADLDAGDPLEHGAEGARIRRTLQLARSRFVPRVGHGRRRGARGACDAAWPGRRSLDTRNLRGGRCALVHLVHLGRRHSVTGGQCSRAVASGVGTRDVPEQKR